MERAEEVNQVSNVDLALRTRSKPKQMDEDAAHERFQHLPQVLDS
jgi:hypothetical protein